MKQKRSEIEIVTAQQMNLCPLVLRLLIWHLQVSLEIWYANEVKRVGDMKSCSRSRIRFIIFLIFLHQLANNEHDVADDGESENQEHQRDRWLHVENFVADCVWDPVEQLQDDDDSVGDQPWEDVRRAEDQEAAEKENVWCDVQRWSRQPGLLSILQRDVLVAPVPECVGLVADIAVDSCELVHGFDKSNQGADDAQPEANEEPVRARQFGMQILSEAGDCVLERNVKQVDVFDFDGLIANP